VFILVAIEVTGGGTLRCIGAADGEIVVFSLLCVVVTEGTAMFKSGMRGDESRPLLCNVLVIVVVEGTVLFTTGMRDDGSKLLCAVVIVPLFAGMKNRPNYWRYSP